MMKSCNSKNSWTGISFALSTLTAFSFATSSQPAAAITLGGFTWDEGNAVTSGSIISGKESISVFPAIFPADPAKTVASILGLDSPPNSTSVDLGDANNRSIIELGWGESSLTNKTGNDFVIYESGSSPRPEAFAVAVRKRGESSFTNFLYKFSSAWVPDNYVFATGFDLSDFGLRDGDAIDAIRISNLIKTDKVSDEGQGFLQGQFEPLPGPLGDGSFLDDQFDADITFVVGLHDVVAPRPQTSVPEPASMVGLLAFGAFGVGRILKRKYQQKA